MASKDRVRVGLLGCGTVGGGVLRLLSENARYLHDRVGAPIEVVRALVRDPEKERAKEVDRAILTTDPERVLADPDIDVIVEVMGGVDPALGFVERALSRKQSVVTANKMLLAVHGPALVKRAIDAGVDLAFEAAVGGGIPIIRTLRESLASDEVTAIHGIVNGTCNYMLTRMQKNGLSFDQALREAQEKGYAEAEPSLDVDGHDAAHKLVVLAMLAFGAAVPSDRVHTEGIRGIEPVDHEFAGRFGFVIKHLAVGRDRGDSIELRVHPTLVPKDAILANVNGVLNAIAIEGRALGPVLLSGRGAGDLPTAVSVVADLVEVAHARLNGAAGLMTRGIHLDARDVAPIGDTSCPFYLRFAVFDRPGVLAAITGALGEASVSIEQMVQLGRGDASGAPVQVVMMTHVANERDVERALTSIAGASFVASPPRKIRVLAS